MRRQLPNTDGKLLRYTQANMPIPFTAVYQKTADWWVAWVEELPGANTQGKTIEEARENLREAVTLILEVNREQSRQDVGDAAVIREELLVPVA